MLADFLEDFALVEKASRPDGLGGVIEEWRDGGLFRGGVTHVPGGEAEVAGQPMPRSAPMLVHETSVGFRLGQHVRRIADGALFRVCGRDQVIPGRAWVRYGQAPVEEVPR